ncbi:hypothetical protein E0Z10_g6758 [Xylaria hypoxylon]|uniref:Store-operated calcium entry-associated regulatory factor n=1 Tax=Xylaria hypoxylon TaxID=37992 RepID=A0A4Z0YSC2_9PEZI|nr:hypothetical protein E0Z10_g6758 [Xylaria hypoxylon]
MHTSVVLSALLGLLAASVAAKAKPKDAILLSEVQSLTLRANKQTSHRRVSAIPQLKCVSSRQLLRRRGHRVVVHRDAAARAQARRHRCHLRGLRPAPTDPYVLRGSCAVEYRLVLTDLGEQKFPEIANAGSGGWFSGWRSGGGSKPPEREGEGTDLGAWFFSIIFVGVLLWIVYSAWTQANIPDAARRRPRNGWFGGGGGGFDPGFGPDGGGGDDYDPPPPYNKYHGSSSRQDQQGWRPGFWSGVAGGAAAGYLAGNRGNRQEEPRNYYGGGGGTSWGSRPGPSSSSRGSDSGAASTSSSRYTSTGFGSTSRR